MVMPRPGNIAMTNICSHQVLCLSGSPLGNLEPVEPGKSHENHFHDNDSDNYIQYIPLRVTGGTQGALIL